MGLDLTSFAAALKAHYTTERVQNMVYKTNPFLALVRKMEDMGGDSFVQPVIYGNPQSRSATFATAQTGAASTSTNIVKFAVTRVKDYAVVTIDGETLEASKKDVDAFMRARTTEIDGAMNSISRSLATSLFRSGYGAIGQIADASTASTTMTLGSSTALDPDSVVNFEKDMQVVFSSSENGATLRNSGASLTVTKVNPSTGTVILSGNMSSVTGVVQNDYVFIKGDRQDSATPTRLKVAGLEAWCPYTAPSSSENFFGVDRSAHGRLGGVRYDGTTLPIEQALIKASVLVGREGGKPDVCVLNHKNYGDLINSLGSKVQYVDLKANASIGFRGIELFTPTGTVKVVPDMNCPSNRAFLLQMDTWLLGSLGMAPRILNYDGLEALRQASADGIEVRIGYYGNLICTAPGFNCVVAL